MDLRPHRARRRALLAPVVGLLAALAAGGADAAGPGAGTEPAPPKTQSFNDLPDATEPIRFTSNEGRFSVIFPSGCAKVRSRLRVGGGSKSPQDANLVFTSCDRTGHPNEGCSVTAHVAGARDLDPAAAAARVIDQVRLVLDGYNVKPAAQTPLRRDFGKHGVVEGVEVVAHPEGTAGDICVRGLLHDEDIYVLTAWKASGGMAADPEFSDFFQSFLPWADAAFMQGK